MPIKLGSEKISSRQKRVIKRIVDMPPEMVIRYLMEIISDPDIISGQETLDPEWINIYQQWIQSDISKYLPPEERENLKKIDQIFSKFLYDEEISKIDPKKVNIAFLLGAGASKPKPSDIPTVKELLPDLLTRARRLDRVDLQKLADFCNETGIDNIEDLLTAAQLSEFCSRNPSVLKLVDFLIYRRETQSKNPYYHRSQGPSADLSAVAFLQDTLQVLFGLLSSRMLPAKPNQAHIAIAKYVRSKTQSTIVTTNYDCCMDLALGLQKANYSYLVEFANIKAPSGSASEATQLIKLHGSLNWYYCETCQQVHLIDIEKTVKEYLNDESCYSIIAVCKDCGGQRRGLLVPPLAMKFDLAPPLTPLIEKAQESFNMADAIVVVGFSFADADMYISRMLTKSMQINNNVKIIVFDPDYDVANKLRRQLSLRIPEFDEKRVIYIPGDCASLLPEFLKGELKESIEEDSDSAQLRHDESSNQKDEK